ncbi:putative aldouronate transport system permease protein [Paenibacillus eucommiae]|uniref:Aldouronate transport system permease protein n=2 Tax=Paenibacillus eucommiae TaxID=1355755 RepID=A0ABS4J053_9BACL|nr:putative aldouronate transport system permease protein [Paenibacillus eucommiae]
MNKRFTSEMPLHLMILPGFILVFIYQYIPMYGVLMAFQNYIPAKGIWGSEWVGLDNFKYIFSLPDTIQVIWNTIFIAMLKIVAGLVVPIVTSIMLNEIGRAYFKRMLQTLIYIPHFLSWVILGGILIDLLSPSQGLVNQFLTGIGLQPIFFLGDNTWFPYTLMISDTWKEFGFSTIVYLAALAGINPSLYEAAVIDGAGHWRRTWHITLPGLRPIIVLLVTLSLGQVLNAGFEQVFVLYSPQVYDSGDILDTLVYRMGLVDLNYSIATAIGLFKSVVSLLLIGASYWLAYRWANYRIF